LHNQNKMLHILLLSAFAAEEISVSTIQNDGSVIDKLSIGDRVNTDIIIRELCVGQECYDNVICRLDFSYQSKVSPICSEHYYACPHNIRCTLNEDKTVSCDECPESDVSDLSRYLVSVFLEIIFLVGCIAGCISASCSGCYRTRGQNSYNKMSPGENRPPV
jgi:hypothetical protein